MSKDRTQPQSRAGSVDDALHRPQHHSASPVNTPITDRQTEGGDVVGIPCGVQGSCQTEQVGCPGDYYTDGIDESFVAFFTVDDYSEWLEKNAKRLPDHGKAARWAIATTAQYSDFIHCNLLINNLIYDLGIAGQLIYDVRHRPIPPTELLKVTYPYSANPKRWSKDWRIEEARSLQWANGQRVGSVPMQCVTSIQRVIGIEECFMSPDELYRLMLENNNTVERNKER